MQSVLYVVRVQVDPSVEREWCDWQDRVHLPDLLAQPGFQTATRYRRADASGDWPEYVLVMRLASFDALQTYLAGPACQQLRQDHQVRYGGHTRVSREILTEESTTYLMVKGDEQ